jgi:hypothetical protein
VVEIERAFRQSRLVQRIVMHRASIRIDFETEVDWHETHLLLKAAFPVDIRAARADFDIQWGQIDRPTHRNTSWDAAQFEVPAQKWADLSEGNYGVALLNDCKYGYDVRGDVMRLSLIKSATMPDSGADQGHHRFTYAAAAPGRHARDRARGGGGAELPAACDRAVARRGSAARLGPVAHCLSQRAVIETVKPAQDGRGAIIRLYEAHNTRGEVEIVLAPDIVAVERVGLLEDGGTPMAIENRRLRLHLTPYEIVTLRLLGRGVGRRFSRNLVIFLRRKMRPGYCAAARVGPGAPVRAVQASYWLRNTSPRQIVEENGTVSAGRSPGPSPRTGAASPPCCPAAFHRLEAFQRGHVDLVHGRAHQDHVLDRAIFGHAVLHQVLKEPGIGEIEGLVDPRVTSSGTVSTSWRLMLRKCWVPGTRPTSATWGFDVL